MAKYIVGLCIAVITLWHCAKAQGVGIVEIDIRQRLDDFLLAAVKQEHFSGVALIVHHEKILLHKGYGPANDKDENESDTVFHVASITKQFTAAAIMKLWENGSIDLHASINTYLPKEYQSKTWNKVTVHHLLSHTGGVVDYDDATHYSAAKNGFCFKSAINAMIDESSKKKLEFEPGAGWNYCNIGYTLLGAILENITGHPYHILIQEYFFTPLTMFSSGVHEENYVIEKGHATGHRWDNMQKKLVDDDETRWLVTSPDGSMFTTSEDLYKWSFVIAGKRPDIVSPEILKRMTTPASEVFLPYGSYGYGLFLDDSSGTERIHHPGWIVGFRSHFCLYPEKDLFILVLCNNTTTDPLQISSGLSEIMGEKGFWIAV